MFSYKSHHLHILTCGNAIYTHLYCIDKYSRGGDQCVEVASYLAEGNMLHIHQYNWRSVKAYSIARLFVRISIVGVLGLLYFATMLSVPEPTAQAHQYSDSVTNMIEKVFGPYTAEAIHVARCESGLNARAHNHVSVRGSHSAGVFQILYPGTWRGTSQARRSPYDAWTNILAAHEIFVRDGHSWREWVCKPW